GRKEIPVNVRIICATHQDLGSHINEGRFREDLYYRISELTINIPSLREREGDALVLAKVFLERFAREMGRNIRGFDDEARRAIDSYSWPGNVRELEGKVKRAVILADGANITAEDLELEPPEGEEQPFNLKQVREDAERGAVLRALVRCNDNISETATLLGITRPTLYNLLQKFNLKD
ncbi:MAG: sigma 54-interacting transcriptional regulator, partial [Parahaliea sp.]